jgi:hypothetical protein
MFAINIFWNRDEEMRSSTLFTESGNKLIDYAGFFLIGALSLGYVLMSCNYFAQLHVSIPFLNVPFFIGDMVFAACFCLLFVKWLASRRKVDGPVCLLLLYLGFVAIKTVKGYLIWGPLSLRHATLFLYPLFAIFCYSFYRKDFFDNRKKLFFILAALLIITISPFVSFYIYYALPVLFIAAALINSYPGKATRCCFYLLLFLMFPYGFIIKDSRTFIVANLTAIAYVMLGLLSLIKIRRLYKIIFLLSVLCLAITIFIPFFSHSRTAKSLSDIKRTINTYKGFTEFVRLAESDYIKRDLPVRLYNERVYEPHNDESAFKPYMLINWQKLDDVFGLPESVKKWVVRQNATYFKGNEYDAAVNTGKAKRAMDIKKPDAANAVKTKKADKNLRPVVASGAAKPLTTEQDLLNLLRETSDIDDLKPDEEPPVSNTVFRVFIWGDALEDLIKERPVFGFDFGKPFRSRRIEIAHMAEGEWSRDGWISFHNSYIDIVYRAGLPGILMVVFIFVMALFMAFTSIKRQTLAGLLLTGILISWLISANFMEAMEMPYNAIPFWGIFGTTAAYLFKNIKYV